MKKLYIAIICIVALSTQSNAQLKYGPRVGLGSSSLGGGNSGIGVQFGLMINAELRDRMGIQPEVLFAFQTGSENGSYQNSAGKTVSTKTKYTFSYITIPIYGYVPVSKHITFLAGPQIAIVNKGSQITTGSGVTGDAAKRSSVDGIKSGIGIAAGIDFNLSSPLRLGLRFSTTGGDPFSGKSSFVGVTMAYYMDW